MNAPTFALLALSPLVFASNATAQELSIGTRLATDEAAIHFHLDYDSGSYTRMGLTTPGSSGVLALTQTCFDNTIDVDVNAIGGVSFLDALLYPAEAEIVDWGVKFCGGSWYVDQVTFGYASLAPTAVGGNMTVRVYQGTLGWGNPGTLLKELTFANLPSDPGTGMGGLIPRILTIDLGSEAFYLPDGPIGWSTQNHDGLTAPLLVDATLQNGVQNLFDIYSPGPASAATYDDTYFLPAGGFSQDPFENSFYFKINQNSVVPTATLIPGAGSNTQNFNSTTLPWVDWTWTAEVDTTSFQGTTVNIAFVSPGRLSSVFFMGSELITNISLAATVFSIELPGVAHSFPIPNEPALLGRAFFAQGGFVSAISGTHLTNGYELVVGSY